MEYSEFIKTKSLKITESGFQADNLNPALMDFQSHIVKWALKLGRACIFADCGLGKTIMQLEWAHKVHEKTGLPVLILAPLSVSHQTEQEAIKFNIPAKVYVRGEKPEGIVITNYQRLDWLDDFEFAGVVLDESSILKSLAGKFKEKILQRFVDTPYKLACTATPAPNDFMELGNHAEFVGALSHEEMLAMFFVHDGGETSKWRLKRHAEKPFWQWVCSWAACLRNPKDMGFDGSRFVLPPLEYKHHTAEVENTGNYLFPMAAATLQERIQARRESVSDRVPIVAEMVNNSKEPWLIWCNLNSESDALAKAIPDAVEIRGSDSDEKKEKAMDDFLEGKVRVLISKPTICGFGMNFQHCNNMAFVGLTDSYEQLYQAVRRCWRFGQDKPVTVHLICAETEGFTLENIKRKDADAERMYKMLVENINEAKKEVYGESVAKGNITKTDDYEICHGDCVPFVSSLPDNSIHYTIFSPPFASLYTYTNSPLDMGNCKDDDEFITQFKFLVKQLYRVTMAGRLLSFHCMNLPTTKQNHGYIGIRDFRGELIRAFEAEGFIYHSEVVIWKDPVIAMQRTKALGLLHKQIKKDSAMSRQGIPDYLVTMRKPGDNPEPIEHTNETFPVALWQRFASPVWMDINPSDTLQYRSARAEEDERHICPLQLQVIERGIELWSNPNDIVLSPFMGIGSEGFTAIKMGRKFKGAELKESYFEQARKNLDAAKKENYDLFNLGESACA